MCIYAVCPGGEGAVLKTVGPKGFAGSNPVCGAWDTHSNILILVKFLTANQNKRFDSVNNVSFKHWHVAQR